MTLAELFRLKGRKSADTAHDDDLERLVRLAEAGGSGVNLAKMSDEQIRRELFGR